MSTKLKVLGAVVLAFLVATISIMAKMTFDWLLAKPSCDNCMADLIWWQSGCIVGLVWAVVLGMGYKIFGPKTKEFGSRPESQMND